MYLSVVIPTYNRLDALKQALVCLEQQIYPKDDFEVIVIDDASTDGTADFLSQYAPPFAFRYFRQEKNGGPAIARNRGIIAARGSIVLILNDDALLAPDAIGLHAALHKGLQGIDISILGRFDLPSDFTATLWGYLLENSDLLFRFPVQQHNVPVLNYRRWWSCNISTPRKALLEAGLFDERFTDGAWGAEDQELGYRLSLNKVPLLFRSDIHSTHLHHLTIEGFERMSLARGSGGALLFAKHDLPCHYRNNLLTKNVDFWRNIPERVSHYVERFRGLLEQIEGLVLPRKEQEAPYCSWGTFPEVKATFFGMVHSGEREVMSLFAQHTQKLKELIADIERGGVGIEEAAQLLYPPCSLFRAYYDSIAVCSKDEIKKFIKG